MAKCSECTTKMGFSLILPETQWVMCCLSCEIFSKRNSSSKQTGTVMLSIDNLFNKFEEMLVTSETSSN